MTMIRQILYATDLSPASEPAWREAQLLGRLLNAEVLVLHVVGSVTFPAEGYFPPHLYQEMVDAAHQNAHEGLNRLLEGLPEPFLKVRSRVEQGPAGQRILAVAREEAADLIVMGTHGRTGVSRVVLGSVADRVVRQAPCPVLTVRAPADGVPQPRRAISRICYATDFSPAARAAWPLALTLAEAAGAELDLVHVTPLPVPDRHLSPETIGRMAELLEEQGRIEADRFLQPSAFPRERLHVVIGRGVVGEQIVHLAQERAADFIVMGTHGWSGLLRWMLGSVAHHVIQVAPCPVLAVGPGGGQEERPHEA
ncbi:MAG: universal stress protein [Candidatus Rokubacteria bacterium]|nr:universal stress protein [Candidatus Rokubacteria bacterium]